MLNHHRLFHSFRAEENYLTGLTLSDQSLAFLVGARRLIRERLREAIALATTKAGKPAFTATVTPKFFTQGSLAYKTINRPTHLPPQQADADDGCYLPLSFMRGAQPKQSALWFFDVVDRALRSLIAEQGWRGYSTDKDTCCRIILNEELHVDVPLYAIRDEAFALLKAQAIARNYRSLDEAMSSGDPGVPKWLQLVQEDVLMAKRNGSWQASDPREVKEWADTIFSSPGGEQLRRICRYLKGWRDQNWKSGGPSSILLMVIAADVFTPVHARDDLALMEVAGVLKAKLNANVYAPWGDKSEQLNRLDVFGRNNASQQAAALYATLSAAVNAEWETRSAVVAQLRAALGRHFPLKPEWVVAASAPEVVSAYPKVVVPTTSFPRSTKAG